MLKGRWRCLPWVFLGVELRMTITFGCDQLPLLISSLNQQYIISVTSHHRHLLRIIQQVRPHLHEIDKKGNVSSCRTRLSFLFSLSCQPKDTLRECY